MLVLGLVCNVLSTKAQFRESPADSTQYARIYVYRPFTFSAVLLGFGIRKDEQKLFKLRNHSAHEIRVYRAGSVLLSAKSPERKFKMLINVELGKSYYVRCKPGISYLTVNPKLQLVDNELGEREYKEITDEN